VFYSPTDAQVSCLKKIILKFTFKKIPTCFGAVTPSSGGALIRAYESYSCEKKNEKRKK
jgi:hypothetical protein